MISNPLLIGGDHSEHSNANALMKWLLVDTNVATQAVLDIINPSPTARPTTFIDVEGVYLRTEGQLCFIAIHHAVSNENFVVDIHRLGATTFSTPASDGKTTLKTILESPTTPKGIFDVRNGSAALYP